MNPYEYIKGTFERYNRWESTFIRAMGLGLAGVGAALLIPLLCGLCFGNDVIPFLVPMLFCACVSLPLLMFFGPGRDLRPVDGLFIMVVLWGMVTAAAAVPFVMFGMSFTDGFFESMSGFTTTGATTIGDFGKYPESLFLWRSLTQWIGGIAIILIFVTLFPVLGFGGRSVFRDEMSAFGQRNFSAKMRDVAKEFCLVYAILSGIFLVACLIMGVNAFESLCLTFSTISTGGFLPYHSDVGIGVYPVYIQLLVVVFMFLGGTNFYLHYQRMYKKKGAGYLKNSEFRSMLIFFILVSAAIFGITYAAGTDVLTHVKDVVFTVVSMGTSTGFIVSDINGWMAVPAALAILFLMMIIGGSSGSTSGGLKTGRVVALLKSLTLDVKKRIHPRAVSDVKLGRETLDEGRISAAYVLLTLFMVTIIAGYLGLLILEPSLDSESALMISMTSVSNTGFVGPYAGVGFAEFSGSSKVLLTLLMWIGRLEVGTAIIIFTPFFWKEVLRGGWKLRKMEGRSL